MPQKTSYITTREFDARFKPLEELAKKIDQKQDAQIVQLTTMQTKFDQGMIAGKRHIGLSASTWSAIVSTVAVSLWEILRSKVFGAR